ncbi:MAG: hypothetical protein ACJ73E_06890 [Mycobacteriales bacterium]
MPGCGVQPLRALVPAAGAARAAREAVAVGRVRRAGAVPMPVSRSRRR